MSTKIVSQMLAVGAALVCGAQTIEAAAVGPYAPGIPAWELQSRGNKQSLDSASKVLYWPILEGEKLLLWELESQDFQSILNVQFSNTQIQYTSGGILFDDLWFCFEQICPDKFFRYEGTERPKFIVYSISALLIWL